MADGDQQPAAPQPAAPAADPRDAKIAQLEQRLKYFEDEVAPFVESASTIISAISQDPTLKEGVKGAVMKQYGQQPPAPQPQPQAPQPQAPQPQAPAPQPQPQSDPRVDNMDAKARDDIIGRVEARLKLSDKTPEEKSAIRANVRERMARYGQTILSIPVTALENILTDHYVMNELDTHPESTRVQELVEAKNNPAVIPASPSQSQTPDATQLTPEQEKWSKKLGTDPNKVTSFLKEFNEKGVATYTPKEDKPAQSQQVPSGTPPTPEPQPVAPQQ